ncbi:inositol monophosphatase [bacterium]|nr:inositol monophosphatase [bacterium]
MNRDILDRLDFAKETAIKAGEILAKNFGGRHKGTMKSSREVVTETDLESERYILNAIENRYGEPVLSEESNPNTDTKGPLWIVDPLDGTNNFAAGIPFFAVIISFAIDSSTKLGVIYEPLRKELFWSDGILSYLGESRINISNTEKLGDCIAATGFPYLRGLGTNSNLENFVRITMAVRGIRRIGSAGLDLAYTAAGRFDIYWELGLKPWDISAGELIVRCAGGKTGRFDGSPWSLGMQAILASNPQIFNYVSNILSCE